MNTPETENTAAVPFPEKTTNALPSIVIDDGMERVPIRNKFGTEIGVFFCRPTDIGIVDRYNNFVKNFDTITEPLKNAAIQNDGTADKDDQRSFDALNEAEKRLNDALNILFGGNFAEAFFGQMHPFSPVGGRFYCELAIEAVGQYINARFDHEINRSEARVEKYTHGYRTGKHSKSRKHNSNRGGQHT